MSKLLESAIDFIKLLNLPSQWLLLSGIIIIIIIGLWDGLTVTVGI